MSNLLPIDPIDYLVIGHVTQDLTPAGATLGGTVSYAARTAKALGLRVGVVTACRPDLDLINMKDIIVAAYPSDENTTFENIQTPAGRVQIIHHQAAGLDISAVPETWRSTPIVHLGPVANELDPHLAKAFPNSFVGVTPQGWLRTWDKEGRVSLGEWPEAEFVLSNCSAAVLSIEDVKGDENRIEEMLASVRILVVTEGAAGARIYWNGDVRRVKPPHMEEVDPIGAGDIFATSFFYRLFGTRDPWEAARFATQLASKSVIRRGLDGIPTQDEIYAAMTEILTNR